MCKYCDDSVKWNEVYNNSFYEIYPDIKQNKWDKRYLDMAENVAQWSKDSTKIGAVIVGNYGQILSTGYNGFPRNHYDNPEFYENREEKYKRIIHAEMNAIYNSSLTGISLKNSTLYVHGLPPCSSCALGIVQVGISRVVVKQKDIDNNVRWGESWELAKTFFQEARIELAVI